MIEQIKELIERMEIAKIEIAKEIEMRKETCKQIDKTLTIYRDYIKYQKTN